MYAICGIRTPPTVHKKAQKNIIRYIDPYRETSLRYMGYANDLGEAFTPYLPDWGLPASYSIAATYVLFDTIDKGQKAYETAEEIDRIKDTLRASVETLTWQLLASVFCPGSIIHVIVSATATLLARCHLDDVSSLHFLPTFMGVLAIPVIIKPIDETIDKFVNDVKTTESVHFAFVSVPPILYLIATVIKKMKT